MSRATSGRTSKTWRFADMNTYHLTPKSANAKTGPIPVSTTSKDSCFSGCAFYDNGCYAEQGKLGMHWRKVSNGTQANLLSIDALAAAVAKFPAGQLWRHNQAGDLPGMGDRIDSQSLQTIALANRGRAGFTYTHKPVLDEQSPHAAANRRAIAAANAAGFAINLSANNLDHADQLCDLNIGPVCVVVAPDQSANMQTPAGRKVVICPATQRDDVTCATCKLCSRQSAGRPIVAFPAHGPGKSKAAAAAIRFQSNPRIAAAA